MSEELTTQIEDSAVAEMAQNITNLFDQTFGALIERRDSRYANEIAPLDAEIQSLAQERGTIEEEARNLELLLPARAREAQRQADVLLLAGKPEEAATKLAEMREAEAAPEVMRTRQQEIDLRLAAIAGERQAIARRIFEVRFIECQTVVRAAEHGLFCTLLDGLKASFYEFQERTDTGGTLAAPFSFLVKNYYLESLTADARSAEWQAARKWYAGR